MKLGVMSVMVDDQAKALSFYTDVLGFVKQEDLPLGEYRWLTVVSPEAPDGVQLLLEPAGYSFAKTYQRELRDAGISALLLFVDDLDAEYERLKGQGVAFDGEPSAPAGGPATVMFDDTCGNLVRLVQG